MKTIKGDLIQLAKQGMFDVIVHGCNCFCQMGAGIARQVREQCPNAYLADRNTIPGDKSKLGKLSWGGPEKEGFICVNAYTQYGYSRNKVDVDYDSVKECFKRIAEQFSDKTIGIPMIGAGLAGGDWNTICAIIEEELEDVDLTLVLYDK